jgi:hypothetical protein
VRTRLALLTALAAVMLPASAFADDSGTPSQAADASCLTSAGTLDGLSIRGVRVGVRARIRDAQGNPLVLKAVSYCVDGGGEFSFALDRNSDVVLVLSTADGDSIGPINPTSPSQSARAEFPQMKKLVKTPVAAAYRVDSRRQLLLGVADGRVAYVAAADRLLLDYPSKLGYYLHRLGY